MAYVYFNELDFEHVRENCSHFLVLSFKIVFGEVFENKIKLKSEMNEPKVDAMETPLLEIILKSEINLNKSDKKAGP